MINIEEIVNLIKQYNALGLAEVINYDKLNLYAITHHSTFIEGSTLTEIETRLLLDEGLTPKGKPLEHSLMTKYHHNALLFILEQAKDKAAIDVDFVKAINGRVLKSTGAYYKTILGEVDSSKGEFRLSNVSAGTRYFVNYSKVPSLTKKLCQELNEQLFAATTIEEQLYLAFDAHFDLVSIHPFYDGNGRTSRLLMNYIQAYFNLPLALVFKEDKADYFEALEKTRNEESLTWFRQFMLGQYKRYLTDEIRKFKDLNNTEKKGSGFSFIF